MSSISDKQLVDVFQDERAKEVQKLFNTIANKEDEKACCERLFNVIREVAKEKGFKELLAALKEKA